MYPKFENQIKDRETTVKEQNVQIDAERLELDKQQDAERLQLDKQQQSFDQEKQVEEIESDKQKDAIDLEIKNKATEVANKNAETRRGELEIQTALEIDKRNRGEVIDANIPGEVADLA